MGDVVALMQNSPMQFLFRSSALRTEQRLQLLSLVGRGQATGSSGCVRLKLCGPDPNLTISGMLADRNSFVGAQAVCIENQRLVIYLGEVFIVVVHFRCF